MKTIFIGAQFGDEGKGKLVDVFARNHGVVIRYQGGANAGHTVYRDGNGYVFHMIPSGILYPNKICVVGNGCVVDLEGLRTEMDGLGEKGIDFCGRFYISDRATVILPHHIEADKRNNRVGTTGRGVGPAYASRRNRTAVTVGDVYEALKTNDIDLVYRISDDLRFHQIEDDSAEILRAAMRHVDGMKDFVEDTQHLLHALDSRMDMLLEGAQGTFLDIDHGTYPYVTSSNTTIGGAFTGTGLPPRSSDRIIGVAKAYITRVGDGHLPTEQKNAYGEAMQTAGNEFGATTGRPRRCGWFDVPLSRKANELNGFHEIALTKLDILDRFPEIPLCTGYSIDGEKAERFPSTLHDFERAEPVYETMAGWQESTKGATEWDNLPDNAMRYVERIEDEIGVRVSCISTGPGENDIIRRD